MRRAARTVSGLCLFKESANASIDPNGGAFILTQRTAGKTVTAEFTVNPQFADSMSVKSKGLTLKNGASAQPVGSSANPFQVRCGMQLQEINWYDTAYTDVAVGFETYYAPKYFPYLSRQGQVGPVLLEADPRPGLDGGGQHLCEGRGDRIPGYSSPSPRPPSTEKRSPAGSAGTTTAEATS